MALLVVSSCMAGTNAWAQSGDVNVSTSPNAITAAPDTTWEICNNTSFILNLATAFIRDNKMTPKGWDRVRPGQCFGLNPPDGSPRYVYAESSDVHQGGIREWTGNIPLCVSDKDFSADATISCQLQDLETRPYLAIDPTEKSTALVEPDNFGDKAEIAGLQRLLRDNGYDVTRIDGLSGRRTSTSIAAFKKSVELPLDIDSNALIDALAAAATEKQSDVGFQICNNSSQTVWTALATRIDGAWESRGWWSITTEQCVRPYTKSLIGTDAHFYALQESPATEDGPVPDKKLRSVATTPAQFCIAESRFAALGREYCAEAGYIVANFRPLPTDKDGAVIALTDQDFAESSPDGLRR